MATNLYTIMINLLTKKNFLSY